MSSWPRALVLVVAAGLLSACAVTNANGKAKAVSAPPSLTSVVRGRFVSDVELDDGDLAVAPPGKSKPRLSETTAQAMFRAADVVDGTYRFAVLGLGAVTISSGVSTQTTTPGATTTTISAATSAAASPATAPTTSSRPASTASGVTTTTVPGSTTSTGSSVTTQTAVPAAALLPRYDKRLAWIGIAWGAACPARAGRPRLATRYVAVVIDAETGHSVLAYTSGSAVACSGPVQPPSVSRPTELVSVPWHPVGPTSTAVQVTMPACGTYYGWTDVAGTSAATLQVVAQTPFDPSCGSNAPDVQIVSGVVPLGSAQARVPHAVLGPVDGLQTLPGG